MKIADVYESIYNQQNQLIEGLLKNTTNQILTYEETQINHEEYLKNDEKKNEENEQSLSI